MGTSCELFRVNGDTIDGIHISHDGYLSGVGAMLFRSYQDPEKIEALFSHDTWAVGFCPEIEDIEWDEWEEGMKKKPLSAFLEEHEAQDKWAREHYPKVVDDGRFMGLYVYAHGKWAFPMAVADLRAFIETGESPYVMTREFMLANGCDEADLDPQVHEDHRPVNEMVGVLSDDLTSITLDGGEEWTVSGQPGLTLPAPPEELAGKRVRIRTFSMAVSASSDPAVETTRHAVVSKLELYE